MCRIFIALVALTTVAWACNPTGSSTTAPGGNSTTGRKRRSVQEDISVTVVTNKQYAADTVDLNRAVVQKVFNDYKASEGIHYDSSKIVQETKNQGGKFAIAYTVKDDCNRVEQFVKGAKGSSSEVSYALIKCGTQPVVVL